MAIDFLLADNGIATITINRPERMNAMDDEHYSLLSQAWCRVRDEDDIRVAIITGAGEKAFSAGADIKSTLNKQRPVSDMWRTQVDQILNRGLEVWKPVIGAVNGFCLGGGMTLLLATDIRVACESATFGLAEAKRGMLAGNGGSQRIIRQLPYPIAMEMLLTGDSITAQDALRYGLLNKVVATPADVLPAAMEYALRIAKVAPLAAQASKELAIRARDVPLSVGLRMEQLINKILLGTEDAKEGADAFREKRPSRFKGQ